MPLYYTAHEQALKKLDRKLLALFKKEITINPALKNNVNAVIEYYRLSYKKAAKEKTIQAILGSYQDFIAEIESVKMNVANCKPDSKNEEALKNINAAFAKISERCTNRQLDVALLNLAKACEIVFWLATAVTLYASFFLISIPMLLVQPPLGIITGIATLGLFGGVLSNCIRCMTEFRSLTRHRNEYSHEKSLLETFFSKPKPDVIELPIHLEPAINIK